MDGSVIHLLDQQRLQFRRPHTDFRKTECPRRTGERVGDTDQGRVGIGEGTAFTDGLQFRELIGAPGEETLTQRGEGIVWDGSAP